MKKQYGIRMSNDTTAQIDNFAQVHQMSATAAAEFFVKLGIDSLQKNDHLDTRLDVLEGQLKAMQFANYRNLAYLVFLASQDKEKFEKAKAAAEKNVAEIFGDQGDNHHGE